MDANKRGDNDRDPEIATQRVPSKRLKKEALKKSVHKTLKNLEDFTAKEVLSVNASTKSVFLRCKVKDRDGDAVIILEKTAFKENEVGKILTGQTLLNQQLHNDIYGTYACTIQPELNGVKATIIHPATEKHVEKYRSTPACLVVETPKDYSNITKPWIEDTAQSSLQWVENILVHKSEEDRIVFEDPDPELGFILLPDMKWNLEKVEELYLVAIVHKRGITSIRELNNSHVPLLQNIQKKAFIAIKNKFGVDKHHLRAFLHYHPSYYHLHVHFTHMRGNGASAFASIQAERAHMLDTIINNIQMIPNYYQVANLTFALKEDEPLWKKFQKVGKFSTV